jgi:hypothetical protein
MKNAFLQQLFSALIYGAAQSAANATQNGADPKNAGVAAGLGAGLAALGFLLQHPMAQHPSVQQAVAPVVPILPPVSAQ